MRALKFFDRLEDRIRAHLSRAPILYAIVGGFAIVLFWRGVWHTADLIEAGGGVFAPLFTGPNSTLLSAAVLLLTGLFVSFFIGDRIILSGLTHEKKIEEKTEAEVRQEGALLHDIYHTINRLEKEITALKGGEQKK